MLAVCLGCSHLRRGPGSQGLGRGEATGFQRLYRVAYQGPEGSGGLRLALQVAGPDRYQARASDALGRGLWSLELAAGEVRFLDHRRREHCVTSRRVRLPELALEALPVDRLPDVLGGRLPAEPATVSGGVLPTDFRDAEGRRWTATYEEGEPVSWTLWSAGEPLLWWRRGEREQFLSHRRGSQFRWRQTVEELLSAPPAALAPPPGYTGVDCADLLDREGEERDLTPGAGGL